MTIAEPGTRTLGKSASLDPDLEDAIREYLRTYVLWRGIKQATATFGVSRHTLWRFLERGHTGRALPRAVMGAVGDSVEMLEAATWFIVAVGRVLASRPPAKPFRSPYPLSRALEDTLLLLCATPMATVDELSRFGRIPASTLRDRLKKLAKMGMADSVSHSLGVLGPHPHLRHFPTQKGIDAGAMVEYGTETFLREYPVSRQWYRLLADRLDAVATLYRAAALVADADSQGKPVRVDHYRQGPYDMLITLSGGRSVGLLRQGPTLPSANLRYRLRTLENLPHGQRPMATLALAHSDQANRRAVRTLGDPTHHRRTFVATEGELLAGDHKGVVWQQCGNGTELDLPVKVAPGVSLKAIIDWTDRVAEGYANVRKQHNPGAERKPTPDPETLYPEHLRAAMPEPSELLRSSLAVRLTGAEKDALDLLAAWPLCTTDQLAGLMGGVTRRRVNQVLSSLACHSLVRTDGQRHVLTDDGLRGLARRDRAAVGPVVGRWSARKRRRRNARAPGLRRHRPAGYRLPDGAPRRHHRLRRRPERRDRPFARLRGAGPDAHVPFRRRLSLGLDQLRRAPRRLLPAVAPWSVALLPAGVRAPGHHPQAGADPPGELPPVLQQWLAQPGPRRAAASGAVRVPESRCRGGLPARCLRFNPPGPVHVQPPDPCRAWGIGRLMATAAASPCGTEAPGATGPGCKMTILRPRDFL